VFSRLFTPFYTTKTDGLGIGSRSVAPSSRLMAAASGGSGATDRVLATGGSSQRTDVTLFQPVHDVQSSFPEENLIRARVLRPADMKVLPASCGTTGRPCGPR
jgi:hypothetical protein